jgi:hypothetical protein
VTEQDWHDIAAEKAAWQHSFAGGETYYQFNIEDLKRFFFAVQIQRDQEARDGDPV